MAASCTSTTSCSQWSICRRLLSDVDASANHVRCRLRRDPFIAFVEYRESVYRQVDRYRCGSWFISTVGLRLKTAGLQMERVWSTHMQQMNSSHPRWHSMPISLDRQIKADRSVPVVVLLVPTCLSFSKSGGLEACSSQIATKDSKHYWWTMMNMIIVRWKNMLLLVH